MKTKEMLENSKAIYFHPSYRLASNMTHYDKVDLHDRNIKVDLPLL
jgi:hypothetical protein